MQRYATGFDTFHPAAVAVYLLCVAVLTMFMSNPVLLLLSLFGAFGFALTLMGRRVFRKSTLWMGILAIGVVITNPLLSHKGSTPLFFLNENPITLEAVLYGAGLAVLIVSVLFWFSCWNRIMTSDKILFLVGRAIPRLSLVLSMALHFFPLFARRWKELRAAQRALGYESRGIRATLQQFSALLSWSMEHAIVVSKSMQARGHELRGHTHYAIYRLERRDVALMATALVLTGCVIGLKAAGVYQYSFYPSVGPVPHTPQALMGYAVFGLLAMIPMLVEGRERLRWNYLLHRI